MELTCLWTDQGKVHLARDSSSSVATRWLSQGKKSGGVCRARWKEHTGHLRHRHGCGVMCRHGQRAEEEHVSWGVPWASISLWIGGEEESIDIISSSLVTVKCVEQGRFSGLTCLCFTSALTQTDQEAGNPLWRMKKCFLITACFLMQQGKERWGRGNRTCFRHLCFMVMLGCVSAFLVLVSSLLYVPAKKGGNVVGFPQSLILSGRFSLEILC